MAFKEATKWRRSKKTGPENEFTRFEKKLLVEWLGVSSNLGNPKKKEDLIKATSDVRKHRKSSDTPQFKNRLPIEYWVKSFLNRNPGIILRIPESISRAAAVVPASRIKIFFIFTISDKRMVCFMSLIVQMLFAMSMRQILN